MLNFGFKSLSRRQAGWRQVEWQEWHDEKSNSNSTGNLLYLRQLITVLLIDYPTALSSSVDKYPFSSLFNWYDWQCHVKTLM